MENGVVFNLLPWSLLRNDNAHIIKAHFQDVETFQADDLVIDIDTVETYKRAYKIKFNTD